MNTFSLGLAGAVEDFAWDGWDWVRNNVIDQQELYIQYLNKDGEPMDAGLSYAQGVAVGRHHKTTLLPNILGLRLTTRENGHARITIDDLLATLGWSETDVTQFKAYSSFWTDQVNSQILELAGRDPGSAITTMPDIVEGKITKVEDVDTIQQDEPIDHLPRLYQRLQPFVILPSTISGIVVIADPGSLPASSRI